MVWVDNRRHRVRARRWCRHRRPRAVSLRRKLMQRLWENAGDAGATDQLISGMQRRMGEKMHLLAEAMGSVHEVLTPEQRPKVAELLGHGRSGNHGGYGRGKHHER